MGRFVRPKLHRFMNTPNTLFGSTRDVVKERYALRTPSGFVASCLPGWRDAVSVVQISQAMGADFCQLFITLQKGGEGSGNTGELEFVVYVLAGKCLAQLGGKKHKLSAGSYAYAACRSAISGSLRRSPGRSS